MTGIKPISSARLIQKGKDPHSSLGVELYQYPTHIIGYLNLPYPTRKNGEVTVQITTSEISNKFKGEVLEGRMKILLDTNSIQFLIESLENDLPVTIEAGGFSKEITAGGFTKKYQTIKKALRIP